MTMFLTRTAPLGEVIAAAFDVAALQTTDPRTVTRLATRTVQHLLRRARSPSPKPRARPRPLHIEPATLEQLVLLAQGK